MMTSKRKSRRSKNTVNYSDSNSNCKSDDDFEVEFELRSKKAKTKEVIKKDAIKQGKSERKSPAQRLSVEEKVYQRDTEKALEISLSNPMSTNEEQDDDDDDDVVESKTKKSPAEEDSDYEPEQETVYESEDDNDEEEKENDSDFSEEEVSRKTISKEKKTKSKQSFSDSKESVTGNKKQTSVIKETEKQLPSETSASRTKTITANQPLGKKPSTTTSLGSPTVNKDLRSLGLGGVIIKNPGPPIRVGLSRNMKVKPLHSKVSVSH